MSVLPPTGAEHPPGHVLDPTPPAPPAPSAQRRRRAALLGVSLGYFMVLLDLTVLAVAEPDLVASLGMSATGLQWVTTAYTVVFAALLLTAGALADRHGAWRVFRVGTAAFGALSLLCAAAPGTGALVAARAVLGVAAAAVVPSSMAVVARLYPDPAARTRAVAAWAAVSGAAVAAGPLVGGLLVQLAGWRAVFVVNAPIAVLALGLAAGRGAASPPGTRRIDWPAQAGACLALALATDAVIAVGGGAWRHAAVSAVLSVAAGSAFVRRELRSTAPVLGAGLLRSPVVRAGLAVGAAVNFALAGDLFVLPLLFQGDRGLGALATGVALLPLTLPFVVNPPLTGRIVVAVGPRTPIVGGTVLLAVGALVLAAGSRAGAGYAVLAVGLLLTGAGVSFVLPAVVAALVEAAPPGTAGAVAGVLNACRQSGATLGVAVMGACAGTTAHPTGSAAALLVPAGVCAAAGLWFAVRTSPSR
ncbi:MFS transporter [Kitasatospora sp. NPDC051853]|uniref:MFS transporter n=1 Tax=Kitasatospora sp. NPDC051853 TaxID=3364058 RepID=UPI0037A8CE6F